jgi:ABC-2 type transport system permease protein
VADSGTAAAYRHLVLAQIRSQLQYRASFAMDVAGSLIFGLIDIASISVMFRVAPALGGFTFRQTFLMAALANTAYSIAELTVGNLDRLRFYVRTGLLDAILVRPLSTLGQLVAVDFAPRRLGRLALGVVSIVLAAGATHVEATAANVTLLAIAPICGAAIFGALFVATSVVTFWWVESIEFSFGFTNGGKDFSSYPTTVYSGLMRRLFAYLLGFAFVAYYPALAVLHRPDPLGGPPWLGWLAPLVAIVATGLAGLAWRTGIRHYRSTGS